jgi:hypothetical protein
VDTRTTAFVRKRLDRIKEACEDALEQTELSAEKAEVNGNEYYDYLGCEDARDYFWRILDLVEEAQGQWWA